MALGVKGGQKLLDHLAGMSKSLATGNAVRVGFLEGATYPDGTSVALVAAVNEFGNPKNNQPPRPFFRNMIYAKSPGWGANMASVLKAAGYDANLALERMGIGIAGQLQDNIRTFTTPELSPVTIAIKGFAKPLIDTGHMLNSVSYQVVHRDFRL